MTVYKGPAQIEWSSLKFQSQGEVTVTLNPETFDVLTDAHGTIDTRIKSRAYTITFTPSGQINGEAINAILAASLRIPGTSVMGGALVVRPLIASQKPLTFARAGMTGLPGLRLGASKTLFGQVTFTALAGDGVDTGIMATFGTFVTPTSTFDPVNILTEPYKGTWAASADPDPADSSMLIDLETEDGWEVTTEMSTEPSMVDSIGIVDYTQSDFKVTITCKPVNITDEAIMEIMQRSTTGMAIRPGDSIHGRTSGGLLEKRSLYLTSRSGYIWTFDNVGVRSDVLTYSAKANRTGTLTFTGLRKFTSGNIVEMISLETP